MYPKIAQFKQVSDFREHLRALGLNLPVDDTIETAREGSPLARTLPIADRVIGNRFCIHPMEGWDANLDGTPSDLTLRRWRNFGASGAKLIWGGEACAVHPDGRANPRQLLATPQHESNLRSLHQALIQAHGNRHATVDDLLVGLQLTHSGRFSRPQGAALAPRIAYHHPLLDARVGVGPADDAATLSDDELEQLADDFVASAQTAKRAGFRMVDVKACHGYLLHELLGARPRPGRFGGDFEGRTRLLRQIVGGIRQTCPRMLIGVRISAFDTLPHQNTNGVGQPVAHEHLLPYACAFGANVQNPLQVDLRETIRLLKLLEQDGVCMVNVSAGSPYYCPHIQRPAMFPPSDGYPSPEDPLISVARQIDATRQLKQAVPGLLLVGTGYSYLQDYLVHVAQAVVRAGWVDLVGLGRMVLSYPELPTDALQTGRLARKRVCRTFSDCTTAPRKGLVSGCFPLDDFYRGLPQAELLKRFKQQIQGNAP